MKRISIYLKPSTSHFVIVDAEGNSVSMTSTVEGPFGSHLMAGGFILNNELTDFSLIPEINGKKVANRVEGNKRAYVIHDSNYYF